MDARNDLALSITTPSDREIVLTRTFKAPRTLVWDAVTKAEHVRRWYGCAAFTFSTCEIDLRVGGSYRYTMRTTDGVEHTMTGVYREIVQPERIVHTERYETTGFTSPDALVTMTLTEQNGRTRMQSVILHPNKDSRDGHINSGMENGARETFDRLEVLLATL
ncbi:MAG TPA: SRPBCC family protein [Burkholderiales bacterium]|nr:SRPBCC family protein [Burkholderiales bacterium]